MQPQKAKKIFKAFLPKARSPSELMQAVTYYRIIIHVAYTVLPQVEQLAFLHMISKNDGGWEIFYLQKRSVC